MAGGAAALPQAHPAFAPASLYFRKYNDGNEELTQCHPIDQPNTTITLDEGKKLCVRWLSESAVFQVCWEDEGAIPRYAKEWKKAQDNNDIQMSVLRYPIQVLKRTIADLEQQDQEDPLTKEKLASATKTLQDKREQQAIQVAEFQAVPTGEGWIKSELSLPLGQAVVTDFVLTSEGQKAMFTVKLAIKGKDVFETISTGFPMEATVKSLFDPDDESLDVSGEVFAPFLGAEESPYLASPTLPVVQQAKQAKQAKRAKQAKQAKRADKNLRMGPYFRA